MTYFLNTKYVRAHPDNSKQRSAHSIEAQLKCRCDDLAKAAVCEAMSEIPGTPRSYILPLEDVSIFIDDVKQTTDVAKDLRHHIGRR